MNEQTATQGAMDYDALTEAELYRIVEGTAQRGIAAS